MMTYSSRAQELPFVTVHDGIGPLRFRGEVIADLSWTYEQAREIGHNRWTDIRVYQVADNKVYRYVVEVIGRSVVYHRVDGSCHKGVTMSVARISEDEDRYDALHPCDLCKPVELDELDDSKKVTVEVDLPKIIKCRNAEQLVGELRGDGSNLSLKILQAVCLVDKKVEEAAAGMRYL